LTIAIVAGTLGAFTRLGNALEPGDERLDQ
jgi:hypothetical protein